MQTSKIFEFFHTLFGSHTAAADYLGINRSYYRDLRNGRKPICPKMTELLQLKFESLLSSRGKRFCLSGVHELERDQQKSPSTSEGQDQPTL